MGISGTDLAITSARAGVARAGATRFGFIPYDVRTDYPGEYVWREQEPPAPNTWTLICDSWVCVQSAKNAFPADAVPVPPVATGGISGSVTYAEAGGISGEDVWLYLASDPSTIIDTVTTGVDGAYSFSGLDDGDYYVRSEFDWFGSPAGSWVAATVAGGGITTANIEVDQPPAPAWPPV